MYACTENYLCVTYNNVEATKTLQYIGIFEHGTWTHKIFYSNLQDMRNIRKQNDTLFELMPKESLLPETLPDMLSLIHIFAFQVVTHTTSTHIHTAETRQNELDYTIPNTYRINSYSLTQRGLITDMHGIFWENEAEESELSQNTYIYTHNIFSIHIIWHFENQFDFIHPLIPFGNPKIEIERRQTVDWAKSIEQSTQPAINHLYFIQ